MNLDFLTEDDENFNEDDMKLLDQFFPSDNEPDSTKVKLLVDQAIVGEAANQILVFEAISPEVISEKL